MPNNINDKMKETVKKSTFNNNQNSTPINATNKKKDTINFNNVIKNLSTSSNTKPWYKKKASIIGLSSTLGVGVLATAIAVPIVLTSKPSSTTVVPPPIVLPPAQQDIVDAFNTKPLTEKITIYNSIVENTTNKVAIASHFLDYKITGFNNFFLVNIDESRANSSAVYNNFKTFLMSSNSSSINNPLLSSIVYATDNIANTILNMIGTGNNSLNPMNAYFSAFFRNNLPIFSAHMYSPIVSNIVNLTIQNDFSIKISFIPNAASNSMTAFYVTPTNDNPYGLYYKQDIVFNNLTLYPGMNNYVKTQILGIM